jgi:LysR family hydrogen peroxide-inducible transcriptional activator
VLLTEIGREIARRGDDLLTGARDLADFARHCAQPLTGRLTLGVIPSLAPYLLPQILPQLQRRYPELRLELREAQTRLLLADIKAGALDAALLALPAGDDDTRAMPLFEDRFLLAVPADDPRSERLRITADDIDQTRLILLEDGHCLRDQALDVCSHSKVQEKQDFRATSLETLRQMVASGGGITLLPQLASTGAYGHARGVAIVPFARPVPVRHVGALWRRTSAKQEAIKAVCDVIAEAAIKQVSA